MRAAFVLVLSLALTGALLAMNYALLQTRSKPATPLPERKAAVTTKRVIRQTVDAPRPALMVGETPFHWSVLESADYAVYVANLRAVGCPEATVRDILLPDLEKLYEARNAELEAEPGDRFWETGDQRDARQRQRTARERALELEQRELVQQLLGAELSYRALQALRSEGFRSGFLELMIGFVDVAKSDKLFQTHQLRERDAEAHSIAREGILLDEDIRALHALRDQFELELAQRLAPGELEELQIRLAALEDIEHLTRAAGVNVTGGELREICRLRYTTHDFLAKALDLEEEIYPEELRQRGDAAFTELLRRFLGAERFADSERGKDPLFREMLQSTEKQGVGKATLLQAYETRRAAEAQARQIRAEAQLTREERNLLLAALRARTTQVLKGQLGPVGFNAYLSQHGQQLTNSLSMPVARPGGDAAR